MKEGPKPQEQTAFQRSLRVMLSGAIAGMVSRTLTAPIERIKVLKQTDSSHFRNLSFVQSFRYMLQTEGWAGFFKGNGANVIRVVPFSALEFFTFDFIRYNILMGAPLTTERSLMIGAVTGMVSSTFTYPLDLVRTLFTLQVTNQQYKGIFKTLVSLYSNEGLHGLYRGWTMSLIGIIPYISIKMTTYNMLKLLFYDEHVKTPVHASLILGALAGITAVTCTYPTDLIKRRLQMKSLDGVKQYYGILDCTKRVFVEEGIPGFYKGLMACYVKVIPSVSTAFAVNTYCKKKLGVVTKSEH